MRLENIVKKFDKIYEKVTTDAFLKMKALGGEVPFFISSYPIEQQNEVYSEIERLKHRLYEKSIEVVDGNLYDIVIEILQERNILERLLEKEKSLGPDKTKKTLLGVLDIQKSVIPHIQRKVAQNPEAKILFLTGIGEVYPYIRSHIILNNLQNAVKHIPTLMFYPGTYTGRSLELFGRFMDDNHYRAFSLDTTEF
jgi:hypothetical protein